MAGCVCGGGGGGGQSKNSGNSYRMCMMYWMMFQCVEGWLQIVLNACVGVGEFIFKLMLFL